MNDEVDGEIIGESEESADHAAPPPRMSEKMTDAEVARFLGRSVRTVERLLEAGRLCNIAGPGKRRLYLRTSVAALKAEMKGELAAIVRAPDSPDLMSEANAEKQIKVDAFASIMATAQNHSEEFFRLATVSMRDVNGDLRKHLAQLQDFHSKEYSRLTERINKLEDERGKYLEHLDRLRLEASKEEDRKANRELIRETFKEAKVIAKAVIATKLKGDAKSSTQNSALDDWLNTIKPEQLDTITQTLTSEQFAGLMAIIQSAQPQEEKKVPDGAS